MDAEDAAAHGKTGWPPGLVEIGAIRFARRCYRFEETVRFYRDLVGLPLHETFEASYGATGAIFALPGPSLTFELVQSDDPGAGDVHEQICLYFPESRAQSAAQQRLRAEGVEPVKSHPYWEATGAVTYLDPDGHGVVFAPFVYGSQQSWLGRARASTSLPLNRRAGGLYGGLIAGDALVLQERRAAFNVEPASGFSRAEAEPLRQEVGE